ncbi:hypothetical protein SUGI_0116130 [Cryptomeria japonica]|nr:hypothetical protein SUGI_0116130 [Cryptomeria japonica]
MSCLAPSSSACPQSFECGSHLFEYPFGAQNSGCGDPALQLDCDHKVNMPLININGYQYYLLEPVEHRKDFPINPMTIVEINMWGNSCNPSNSNHTTEFWSSPQFHIYDEYTNLSLWGECAEENGEYLSTIAHSLECNKSWYYSSSSDSKLPAFCKSLVLLPVKKIDTTNRPSDEDIKNGFKIKWNFSKGCEHCESKKALCIYDSSNPTQLRCELGSPDHPGGSNTANKTAIALGGSVGGVALMAAVAVLCILYMRRRKQPHTRQRSEMEAAQKIGSLSIFPYQELQQATNFFDEKNELGVGGFGAVYLGKLADGRAVAVRRLHQKSSGTGEQFMNEVQILSSLCHPNLVRLYGCTPPQSPITLLVYEFVPNGTLSDHIHDSQRTPTGLPCLGVVLMEIISAKVAVDNKRNRNEISLANMAKDKIRRGVLDELVDPGLKFERNQEVKVTVAAVAELAFECLAIETDSRPIMKEVVARLKEIKEMLPSS